MKVTPRPSACPSSRTCTARTPCHRGGGWQEARDPGPRARLRARSHHQPRWARGSAHGGSQRRLQLREYVGVAHDDLGIGVLDEVPEIVGRLSNADRDRDRADAERSEEGNRECGRVVEDEQDALFACPHRGRAEDVPCDSPAAADPRSSAIVPARHTAGLLPRPASMFRSS